MRSFLLCTLVVATSAAVLRAQDTVSLPTADGFQCPVGPNGSGEGYYIARGYRPNGHLGDDWNGTKGGDTDFGDPVYATAHGVVVFAKNYHVGWGNVVILRHAFYEGLSLKFADSLYGHLNDFNVREGQEVKRGQLIGHIGNNNGMYDAHLHFELRKNINIGMFRGSYPRDNTNYYEPNEFLASHLTCPRGGKTVVVPINTFPATAPPSYVAAKVDTPMYSPGSAPASHLPPTGIGSLRLSRDIPREPLPPPPTPPAAAPKVVLAPPEAPTAPATPTPPKVSTAASFGKKNSARGEKAASEKVAATSTPAPKNPVTASAKVSPPALTSPKGSAPAVTKPLATPAPAKRSAVTASAPVADPEPTKAAPPEVTPQKADTKRKPSILDAEVSEPAAPAPTTTNPIRRSSSGFRVDRFQDLRGLGY